MNSFLFHESMQHGTPDFPFEYFHITPAHPRYNMPFHWHKEWEIIRVIEGSFTVHADNTGYTAHSGDMLLIRDGMLHGGTPENCTYECFLFDLHGLFRNADMVKPYLRPVYRKEILPEIFHAAGAIPDMDRLLGSLSAANRTPSSGLQNPLELIVLSTIGQLFTLILQNGLFTSNQVTPPESAHKIDLIKSVLEYIEQHYASPITLNELARVANLNAKYFCRFFRSITHQTPIEYVNMVRIEKAAQLLQQTNLPITSICMECGFNECSNFIKVFRKYKGTTPNQYRRS